MQGFRIQCPHFMSKKTKAQELNAEETKLEPSALIPS